MEMEVQESDPEHFYINRTTAMSAVVNDCVLGEKCHCNQLTLHTLLATQLQIITQ